MRAVLKAHGVTDRDALPPPAKDLVAFIEQTVGVPIEMISVGPDRAQTLAGSTA